MCFGLALCLLLGLPGTVIAAPPDPHSRPKLGAPVFLQQPPVALAYSGCGGVIAPTVRADYEQQVVERVNAIRASHGLPPLKRVTPLDQAARYHATDMGQDDYFDHDSYDRSGGNLVFACGWDARIRSYYTNWASIAENIAAGYPSPQSVMDGWMDSPGHRDNILGSAVWEIGVGYYEGSGQYRRYWVQDFGRRHGVYPLIINREAASTNSPNVFLYIHGQWNSMRLRNDKGSWTAWQPFRSTLDWTLRSAGGTRTVWVELRSGNQTATSSDMIYLTAPATLGNLPDAVEFTYSIPDGQLFPRSYRVEPQNVGNDVPLTWQLSTSGTWFRLSTTQGITPHSFWIIPATFTTSSPATYSGTVTVTVVDPAGVAGSPHTIRLTLRAVNVRYHYAYLPVVVKSHLR